MIDNGDRTMKKVILAAAFVLTATSAAFAQDFYSPGYGYYDAAPSVTYNAAPGYGYYYGAAPGYGYDRSPPAWYENNTERGGPGPRVGAGSGMGVGSQR
jgi:opacity protein-like surface antigen